MTTKANAINNLGWSEAEWEYWAANPDVREDPYYGAHPAEHYEKYGQYENRPLSTSSGSSSSHDGGGSYHSGESSYHSGDSFDMDSFWDEVMTWFDEQQAAQEEKYAQEQAEYEAYLAEQKKQTDISTRDSLYSSYLEAESSAIGEISGQIKDERANALLLGVDYEIDEDTKNKRINDYLATLWNEGQTSQLNNLISQYGAPSGFAGIRTLGDPAAVDAGGVGSENPVEVSKGQKKKITMEEEEDALGGAENLLGV